MEGRRRAAVRGGAGDEGDWWRMMLGVSPEGRAVRAATEGGWWWIWGGLPRGPRCTHFGRKPAFCNFLLRLRCERVVTR